MTAHPVINKDYTYFIIPSKGKVGPGSYNYKGSVNFQITVDNTNRGLLTGGGNVYVWILDKVSNKSIWGQMIYMNPNEERQLSGSINIDSEMKLVVQTWYWENNQWNFCDSYGEWDFNTGGSSGGTSGGVIIDRKNTYVLLNGRRLPPGTYKVKPEDEAVFHVECVNTGDRQFACLIIGDKETKEGGTDLTDKCDWINSGERWKIDYRFTPSGVQGLYALTAWNGGKSKDVYCCWNFETVKSYPYLKLLKGENQTGIVIGNRYCPPGKYTVNTGEEIQYILIGRNYGADGKCRIDVVDVSTNTVIDRFEQFVKHLDYLGIYDGWLKVNRVYEIKFVAYSFINGQWKKTDEYGC